ncbi:MAG: PspC domain-containing protein [Bacteroidetes bacterium]|nr:PspC domain-containing protein [Bacteroidota bacterium]
MNKTVTINISGIIFHIEEDAYANLSHYLSAIKRHFADTESGNEIMSDIEARIAELLQQKISVSKQVVVADDVNEVIAVMGKPEDFGAEQTQNENFSQQEFSHEKIKRRLFRNPDEKAIGGVCSGLAAYFNVDTVWVRLAMFLLIFFGGLSIWVYIVMWLIIPEAKTTAEKLAMRGETANINNIAQSLKDEANDLKNRFDKNKGKYKRQFYDTAETVRSNFGSALNMVFNIIGRTIGLIFLMLGGLFLVAYIAFLFGVTIQNGNIVNDNWKELLFQSSPHYALALISFIIIFGIPVFMLIYAGIKLLFKIRYSNRWLNRSAGIVWLCGLIMGFAVSVNTYLQFKYSERVRAVVHLPNTDTLVVKLNAAENIVPDWNSNSDDDDEKLYRGYHFEHSEKGYAILGYAALEVVESDNDSTELIIYRSARGSSEKEANENAKDILYAYSQTNNALIFDEVFALPPHSKFKAQHLYAKLKLPKGKVIYFDKSVKYFLDDADNTTNTWEGDMINRRWKMTGNGLQCLDCDNLNERSEDEKVIINSRGIHVHDKNSEVNIDRNGIRVKSKSKKKSGEDE